LPVPSFFFFVLTLLFFSSSLFFTPAVCPIPSLPVKTEVSLIAIEVFGVITGKMCYWPPFPQTRADADCFFRCHLPFPGTLFSPRDCFLYCEEFNAASFVPSLTRVSFKSCRTPTVQLMGLNVIHCLPTCDLSLPSIPALCNAICWCLPIPLLLWAPAYPFLTPRPSLNDDMRSRQDSEPVRVRCLGPCFRVTVRLTRVIKFCMRLRALMEKIACPLFSARADSFC